jgi:hypothetical protein
MDRYYFHLRNSIGAVEDEEGSEHSGLEAARHKAIEDVRSILSEEIRQGIIDLRGRIDVSDTHGNVLLTLRFSEAVELRLG